MDKGIKKGIVIPDTQLPYVDHRAMDAVMQYARDHKFDYWTQLGDLMDFEYASRWTQDNMKVLSGNTFLDDYAEANKFLDEWVKIIRGNNPDAIMAIIEGNHDYRPVKVIEKDPRFEGLIEFHRNLRLRERGIKFIKFWSKGEIYKIGNTSFVHGLYTNQYHAAKMVQRFGTNIFYGHTHDIQQHSLVYQGGGKTIVGQSMGCLCIYNMPYIQGKPTNWQQGFGVFYYFPNGDFSYYIPRIINGRFVSPEGKVYQGKP